MKNAVLTLFLNGVKLSTNAFACPSYSFLADGTEVEKSSRWHILDKGKGMEGMKFTIQVSTLDCTNVVCIQQPSLSNGSNWR